MAGYVQMIREVAKANGQITRKEIRDILGKESRADHVLWELTRQGALERIGRGVYRYKGGKNSRGRQRNPRSRDKEKLIRRAMIIAEKFTAQDIVLACGDVTDSYVYKLIRLYHSLGWLRRYGKRESQMHPGVFERVWRVTLKGREAMTKETVDEDIDVDTLAEATAELCRLVMLGFARRREEDKKRVLELCEVIKLEIGANNGGSDID